jgi:hypothetical protein
VRAHSIYAEASRLHSSPGAATDFTIARQLLPKSEALNRPRARARRMPDAPSWANSQARRQYDWRGRTSQSQRAARRAPAAKAPVRPLGRDALVAESMAGGRVCRFAILHM